MHYQWIKLLGVDQIKLLDEEVKVLVAGVAVRLGANCQQPVKVVNVDVHKDAKKARQNLLAGGHKGLWEGDVALGGEKRLIINLRLDPIHEQTDVLVGGQRYWLFVGDAVRPQVLVLLAARHLWTGLIGAVVGDDAVDQVYSIEEVHQMNCDPVALVLSCKQIKKNSEKGQWSDGRKGGIMNSDEIEIELATSAISSVITGDKRESGPLSPASHIRYISIMTEILRY